MIQNLKLNLIIACAHVAKINFIVLMLLKLILCTHVTKTNLSVKTPKLLLNSSHKTILLLVRWLFKILMLKNEMKSE